MMSYTLFFGIVSAIMLVSLFLFMLTVNEKKLVREMEEESRQLGLDTAPSDEQPSGKRRLTRGETKSLLLILASVVLWFMGYNAVISKYSVYAGKELALDYNLTLLIAQAAAIVAFIPVGIISSKIGRKRQFSRALP